MRRKFQEGDSVRVTKPGRYLSLQGEVGVVLDYKLRVNFYKSAQGSAYRVRFDVGDRWIETEYLTKVS